MDVCSKREMCLLFDTASAWHIFFHTADLLQTQKCLLFCMSLSNGIDPICYLFSLCETLRWFIDGSSPVFPFAAVWDIWVIDHIANATSMCQLASSHQNTLLMAVSACCLCSCCNNAKQRLGTVGLMSIVVTSLMQQQFKDMQQCWQNFKPMSDNCFIADKNDHWWQKQTVFCCGDFHSFSKKLLCLGHHDDLTCSPWCICFLSKIIDAASLWNSFGQCFLFSHPFPLHFVRHDECFQHDIWVMHCASVHFSCICQHGLLAQRESVSLIIKWWWQSHKKHNAAWKTSEKCCSAVLKPETTSTQILKRNHLVLHC